MDGADVAFPRAPPIAVRRVNLCLHLALRALLSGSDVAILAASAEDDSAPRTSLLSFELGRDGNGIEGPVSFPCPQNRHLFDRDVDRFCCHVTRSGDKRNAVGGQAERHHRIGMELQRLQQSGVRRVPDAQVAVVMRREYLRDCSSAPLNIIHFRWQLLDHADALGALAWRPCFPHGYERRLGANLVGRDHKLRRVKLAPPEHLHDAAMVQLAVGLHHCVSMVTSPALGRPKVYPPISGSGSKPWRGLRGDIHSPDGTLMATIRAHHLEQLVPRRPA
mmetsp:Transcript_45742/g.126928  ORF Transcript_45742/g.126928 Transcript_45742/m.126928 type:complete len:277 (+) Transcript_45742:154-984(+)